MNDPLTPPASAQVGREATDLVTTLNGGDTPPKPKLPKEIKGLKDMLDKRLREQNALLEEISNRLETVAKKRNEELRIQELELQAVIRKLFLDVDTLPYPNRLMAQAFRLCSQNGEDGISLAIFNAVGATCRRFVEIGCGPNGGNSGFFAQELGWQGLMLDMQETNIHKIRRKFGTTDVRSQAVRVTRDNVNQLLHDHAITGEVDFLSIDIDGNDYWIWDVLTACNPRVVVVEYNSAFGPNRSVVVPYNDADQEQKSVYYGASLRALDHLARSKGYRLVATEPRGVNAFFVRNDVGTDVPASRVDAVYRLLDRNEQRLDVYSFIAEAGLPLIDLEERRDG